MYFVVFLNDDFTTMELVVRILTDVFGKTAAEATQIMLAVHHKGKGRVGPYSYDVALTKIERATDIARSESAPLRLTIEEE